MPVLSTELTVELVALIVTTEEPDVVITAALIPVRDSLASSCTVIKPAASVEKVAGVILCSRPMSSSLGEPEALRAFLFGERLKNLRKAFKSMKRTPVRRPK